MSRVHYLTTDSFSGAGIRCGLEVTNRRITTVPAQVTCGDCQTKCRRRYDVIAKAEGKDVARAWWKHGEQT